MEGGQEPPLSVGQRTQLIHRWQSGDASARDKLVAHVYPEIRKRAGQMLAKQWGQPRLQPTELVNESFLKILGASDLSFENRIHFMAVIANVMRQVLLDHYRHHGAGKRAHERVTLVTGFAKDEQAFEIEELGDALEALEGISVEFAQIVELKYFAGLSHAEIGLVLGVSEATVKRRWRSARAWLKSYILEEK